MTIASTERRLLAASSTIGVLCSMKRNRTPGAVRAATRETAAPIVANP